MAVANRDVCSSLKRAKAALVDWDGYGLPPDGGLYEVKAHGDLFWFVCLMCDGRLADQPHCRSDCHTFAMRHLLERTSRQARATVSAAAPLAAVPPDEAETTAVVRPRLAPPPQPPCEFVVVGFASSPSPLPQIQTTQLFFHEQEPQINNLAIMMDAMNSQVDVILIALGRLSAGPAATSDSPA